MSPRRILLGLPLACLLGLAACAQSGPGTSTQKPTAPGQGSVLPGSKPPPEEEHVTPPCAADPRKEKASASLLARTKAVAALGKGAVTDADAALAEALAARPGDLAAFTLSTAVTADRNVLRTELTKAAGSVKPLSVPAASPPHKAITRVDKVAKVGAVTLKRAAVEPHDTDWSAWLARKGIANPFAAPAGHQAVELPSEIGELFQATVVFDKSHTVARYGPGLILISSKSGLRSIDFVPLLAEGFKSVLAPAGGLPAAGAGPGTPAPIDSANIMAEIRYAQVVGPLLVVAFAHEGDGYAAKPDGFLAAFDLTTDKLAWVTDAGVANASTFYATGGYVVVGFGTVTPQEKAQAYGQKVVQTGAKLNVVELATGKIVASAPLSARPDYVHGVGKRVYAWSYDGTEAFELGEAPAPIPAPELGSLTRVETKAVSMPTDEHARCWLRNAVVALDHRDGPAVSKAAAAFPPDANLTKALRAAGEFLTERASGRKGIDLSEVEPAPVQASGPKIRQDAPRRALKPKRFAPIKDENLLYPTGVPIQTKSKPAADPLVEFPLPAFPGQRTDIYPHVYGTESIYFAYQDVDATFLLYGQRYLVSVKEESVEKIFDLATYVGQKSDAGALRPLAYAGMFDGQMLVVTNPPTASDPRVPPSFVAALDPKTAQTLWRSEAGVLPRQAIVFEEYVVVVMNRQTGAELVALRRDDGRVATKVALTEPASDFGWDGRGAVFVALPKERKYFTFR